MLYTLTAVAVNIVIAACQQNEAAIFSVNPRRSRQQTDDRPDLPLRIS